MKNRILILFSIFLGMWGILTVRAARLQVFPDVRLEKMKRRQFETSVQIRTRRGAILDRNGHELAASVPSYSLFADPKLIESGSGVARRLGAQLRIPYGSLKKRLKDKSRRFTWVKRQLPQGTKELIEKWDIPGLGFIEEPKRIYPNGSLLAQVMGFIGAEGNGLEGLELQYENVLQGQLKNVILPRDARGRPLLPDGRSLTEVPDGADIQLTIDHETQFTLERELQEAITKFDADAATGLVVDAKTSEILAMATVPTVNLNSGAKYSPGERRNRVVNDAFEPGSVMKTFVIAAALKEGILKPSTRYYCENGRMKVGKYWISEAEVKEKFEWLTVSEILAYSSNVGVAKIAFDLGDARLEQHYLDFGFGAKTGIELPGESRGLMNPRPWRPHLLANISFGHGIAVTPLQVVGAYTAIANGGILKKPLLVRSIRRHNEEEPVEFRAEEIRQVLSPSEAATMRLMLTAATEDKSTGTYARIPGYYVAGKTGTAQKVDMLNGGYMRGAYISSFAGFVPANSPRYVIYVAVDNPKKSYYGSQVAAPIFAKVSPYLVRKAGLAPVQISQSNLIKSEENARTNLQARAVSDLKREHENAESNGFPNLMGLSLREALQQIPNKASGVKIRGQGVVVRTIPSAGAESSPKSRVTLVLENPD